MQDIVIIIMISNVWCCKCFGAKMHKSSTYAELWCYCVYGGMWSKEKVNACTPWREKHQQTNFCFDLSAGEERQTEDDYNKFFLKYDDNSTIDFHSLGDFRGNYAEDSPPQKTM